ncbi:MAG: RdgB/HAM1 family non-canonical purine NTP pyrophosphatase [Deltaproteobacteria bacterium]|nr:RdgB/HAM1 family non-canonical purine NTP pyrophosphatase [Deltaproteobacteria bacterium]MBW2360653.1 RdgB/HAM1 family non-canonical purine NTP pyrophosphatase [Deltaproteobacteria bacterium]
MSARPRVVVATGNAGKLREIRAILADAPVEFAGLDVAGAVAFPDEGDEYRANALAKALAAASQLGLPAIADDSGLEVAGLGGGPGPHSARYGGPGLDAAGRVEHLLAALGDASGAERAACFVCWAAVVTPDGREWSAEGRCQGSIAAAPRGAGGFGYDPVFLLPQGDRVMAEVPAAEKNRISHRARALRALRAAILEAAGVRA